MKIWKFSVDRPITVLMGLVCIVVMGLVSWQKLKLAFLPAVDFPRMWVGAIYPNQNPEILEKTVTRPLEEAFSTIEGVKRISSRTSADDAWVQLDFDWGKSLDMIRLELGLKVEEVRPDLPEGVRQIRIHSFNTDEIPVIQGRISAPGIDLAEHFDLLEKRIKQPLERIPGVANVDLQGVLPKEVFIDLRLDKILEHSIDVDQVIQTLSKDNINLAAGQLHTKGLVFSLRSQGKVENLEEFKQLVVHDSGLKLGDIAEITYEEPPIGYKRHLDGSSALALRVFKESTANLVEVATEANRVIREEIAKDPLLKGVSMFVWGDQAKEIKNGLKSLGEAGLFGAMFAILVLYVFLRRFDATFIVASAIPISILGAFIWMYFLGYTLNVLTLMGLMLAVGMLVDNAVVVLESIVQKVQQGMEKREATVTGTKDVLTALVAATLTTMIVFLSLVISEKSQITIWLGAIGMTICVTLGTSLVISLAVIPLFTSKFLKTKVAGNEPKKDPWLIRKYAALLDRSLAHPVWTGLILLGLLGSIVIPAKQLEKFEGNAIKTSRLEMVYDFHDYFFLSEVEEVVNEVEAFLETYREEWGIDSIYSYLEESHAITLLSFTSESVPTDTFKAMRKTIREGLPRFGGVSFSFEDDAGDSDQALQVQLFGPDRSSLIEAGTQVIATLNSVEDLFDPKPVTPRGKKELRVVVDREKANRYGASPETISQIFGFTLGGTYLPRFSNGQKESDVTLGLRIQDRATMEDVSKLVIGNNVRLGSVIDFKYFDQPDTIERVNRKSYYAVKATYEGKAYAEMKKQVEARLNTLQFPTGVHWSWGEEMMREENEMGDLMFNIAIALILIYLVMASLFESLVQPLLIFSTIFFSLVGVFWFLFLTQTAFEVMTTIGLMLLLGIVVNNGIVMMDHINQLHRRGLEFREAVRQGAKERIRPILMTAGTTVFGMIPMAIGSSSIGDAYYFPLARCVIGGLTSSTLLTLIGLPSVLLGSQWLGQKMRSGGRWLWGKRPWQKSPSEVSA